MIVFGLKAFGYVYTEAEEWVSTVFFHIFFIPLIPYKSIQVEEHDFVFGDKGVETFLNPKSIFTAYARSLLMITLVVSFLYVWSILAYESTYDESRMPRAYAAGGIFLISAFLWSFMQFRFGTSSIEPVPGKVSYVTKSRIAFILLLLIISVPFTLLLHIGHLLFFSMNGFTQL